MKPKNVQNDHPLTIQEQYLRKHKNHHRQVAFLRIFLLGIFLILWEISADAYWIDSFFFSSPRRVVLCLIQLWTERSSDAYRHYFIRNHIKFPFSVCCQSPARHPIVVL